MFPHPAGRADPRNYGGRPGMGYGQCMEQCCRQYGSPQWGQGPSSYQYNQPPGMGGRYGMRQPPQRRLQPPNPFMYQGPMAGPGLPPYVTTRRPHHDYGTSSPGGDPCGGMWDDLNVGGDGFPDTSWNSSHSVHPSCEAWASMTDSTPFSSSSSCGSGGYMNTSWPNEDQPSLGNVSRRPGLNCPNPQVHQGYTQGCTIRHQNENPGLFTRIMNKIRPPPAKCPLQPRAAAPKKIGGVTQDVSCFRPMGSSSSPGEAFNALDDLWNPRKIRRWGCVNNWDQHKESQWKQVIENKMGNCGPAGRSVENKVHEALDALHQEGADCIAFRMFYGILKRNEDVYLNPYLSLMSDEEFLKLIVALNSFYFEDKDKAKLFLDHPPPTWIEKIMQKETLAILDPNTRAPSIVRRFWEVLLDWYVHKLVAKGDPSASCAASKTASQSSISSSV